MTETEPKRSVPWGMFDVLLVLILFFFLPGWLKPAVALLPESFREEWLTIKKEDIPKGISLKEDSKKEDSAARHSLTGKSRFKERVQAAADFFFPRSRAAEQKPKKEILRGAHPLTVMIYIARNTPRFSWVLILSFLAGVITAPLAEEFVFRVVLLQGLERWCPFSFVIVPIQALLFAVIHIRTSDGITSLAELNRILNGMTVLFVAHILLVIFSIVWLRTVRGAAWSDFGFRKKGWLKGIFTGIGLFILIWPAMLAVQKLVLLLRPDAVPDPAPIFVLALALGFLFLRTRQFTANLAMHVALNLTSFCGILWLIKTGGLG